MVRILDTKLVFSRALALLAAKDRNRLLRRGGVPWAKLLLLILILARLVVDVLVCKWLLLKLLKLEFAVENGGVLVVRLVPVVLFVLFVLVVFVVCAEVVRLLLLLLLLW